MSTQDPTPFAPNSPDLFSALDLAGEPTEEEQADDTARPGSRTFDDPTYGSRDLGGRCPDCNSLVDTRLKASYSDGEVSLKLTGFCRRESCGAVIDSDPIVAAGFESKHY